MKGKLGRGRVRARSKSLEGVGLRKVGRARSSVEQRNAKDPGDSVQCAVIDGRRSCAVVFVASFWPLQRLVVGGRVRRFRMAGVVSVYWIGGLAVCDRHFIMRNRQAKSCLSTKTELQKKFPASASASCSASSMRGLYRREKGEWAAMRRMLLMLGVRAPLLDLVPPTRDDVQSSQGGLLRSTTGELGKSRIRRDRQGEESD